MEEIKKTITVTSPLLPPLDEFVEYLEDIWERKWLTNNGYYHQELEKELCKYLGVKFISLFSNGTLALITALQALKIKGEVITTPYSFVATSHSLIWNGITPVFVDICENDFNIDVEKIEAAITPLTTAIMPVHVYGTPCNVKRIEEIAHKHNLKVIYDAAHAFGVKTNNESVLNYGDLSILSFHATKVFSTIEGGAIICHSAEMKQHIDDLKNFGFRDEVTVVAPGINAKLNEVQSAFGLLSLKKVDNSIEKRKQIATIYEKHLNNIPGITIYSDIEGVIQNYSYYPILVDQLNYGISRDELYMKLKSENILARRYFYPLISNFSTYSNLKSADKHNLPIANIISDTILCLPIHDTLTENDVKRVIDCILEKSN